MTRSYSDGSYGQHKSIKLGPTESLLTSTHASATTLLRYTFMYPAKIIDWNVEMISGGTDMTNATAWTIAKSLAGTGAASACGTADMLAATATHADGTVIDGSATETAFTAGDDVLFQLEGTPAQAMTVGINLEVIETFEVADT
jgi:hypothetical protein